MQGIENLGSTCAINSLIQIIARNDILRNIILNNNFAEDTISDQLKEIIDLMYVKNNSIIPRKFINTLYNIFKDIFYLPVLHKINGIPWKELKNRNEKPIEDSDLLNIIPEKYIKDA